jgi:hypothetical protein
MVKITLYDAQEDLYVPHGQTRVFGRLDLSKCAADLYAAHLPLTVTVKNDMFTVNGSAPRCFNDNRIQVCDL